MTRYELFEAWLTPKEWATWKKHSLRRFMEIHAVSLHTAKGIRKRYLNEQITIDLSSSFEVNEEWDDMTNRHLRWVATPQGHSYWSSVNNRSEPIRTPPPMRAVINNVN